MQAAAAASRLSEDIPQPLAGGASWQEVQLTISLEPAAVTAAAAGASIATT
jgi:hypothetical protein